MTEDAAAQHPPTGIVGRPEPGTAVWFRWRKWDGSPHWLHECIYLGSDRWGDWFGQHAGWHSSRPGKDVQIRQPNVTLLPPTGDYAFTHNAAPQRTRVYIDIAWDVRWDGDEPTGIDMDLDVVRRETDASYLDREGVLRQPGDVYIEDRDEWDEHRVAYGYPRDIVERLEAVAVDLERRVRADEEPFDDATAHHWLRRLADFADVAPPAEPGLDGPGLGGPGTAA